MGRVDETVVAFPLPHGQGRRQGKHRGVKKGRDELEGTETCAARPPWHTTYLHSVWLLILFLYALPRRQSPYPSLRGATVLKCVTIDYYATIREVVYNLHTIRSNKDGLFKASPKKKKKKKKKK